MKLNITPRSKQKSGMTLLELTVVILVLLSLISILIIGARAWKRGSDRSGCLINMRNMQVAMRGEMNMAGKAPGQDGYAIGKLIGDGLFLRVAPKCPTDGAPYVPAADGNYPPLGTLAIVCNSSEKALHFFTADTKPD